jgi:formylglycine-generating enzyme required for sulfatase activity
MLRAQDSQRGQDRFGLLVGYEYGVDKPEALHTPGANVDGVKRALESMSFDVTLTKKNEPPAPSIKAAVDEFVLKLRRHPGSVAFFYFSGHGAEIQGQQYLLPYDASFGSLARTGVTVDWIAQRLDESKARLIFIVVESCRHLTASGAAQRPRVDRIGRIPDRTVLVYSVPEDQTSYDVIDPRTRRSFFADSLISVLEQTCLDYREAFALLGPLLAIRGVKSGYDPENDSWKKPFSFWCPAELNPARDPNQVLLNSTDGLTYTFISPGELTLGCVSTDMMCQHETDSKKAGPWSDLFLPPGKLSLGCVSSGSCLSQEARAKTESGGDFWIGQTEVTVQAYQRVMGVLQKNSFATPTYNPKWILPHLPVTLVAQIEAAAYCKKVGGHLPSEFEWEFAARRDFGDTPYPWKIGESPRDHANFGAEDGTGSEEGRDRWGGSPAPAAWFDPTPTTKLFDIAGNAAEWVSEPYVEEGNDELGVVRGGSWRSTAFDLRLSARLLIPKDSRDNSVGFRCVLPSSYSRDHQ